MWGWQSNTQTSSLIVHPCTKVFYVIHRVKNMKPRNTPQASGPKEGTLLKRDNPVISPSMVREYLLVIDRAKCLNTVDADGTRFLNFSAGAGMDVGWKHPVTNTGIAILNRFFSVEAG
jgi:hypothetical protein